MILTMGQALVPNALRVAAVWGTTVVALKTLGKGESFVLGDVVGADLPIPDGIEMAQSPLRGGQGGWELDTRGCVGGLLTLRGRAEDPVAIARAGAPVPVMPGDYGLIQYGQFAIFFQYTAQPIAMSSFKGPELLTLLAIFCSAILHLGMLGLVRTLRDGFTVAVTPDGPRGPYRSFAPGALVAAHRASAPVVAFGVHASRAWVLKSWDQFMIPMPFARLTIVFDTPMKVPGNDARDAADAVSLFTERMALVAARAAG